MKMLLSLCVFVLSGLSLTLGHNYGLGALHYAQSSPTENGHGVYYGSSLDGDRVPQRQEAEPKQKESPSEIDNKVVTPANPSANRGVTTPPRMESGFQPLSGASVQRGAARFVEGVRQGVIRGLDEALGLPQRVNQENNDVRAPSYNNLAGQEPNVPQPFLYQGNSRQNGARAYTGQRLTGVTYQQPPSRPSQQPTVYVQIPPAYQQVPSSYQAAAAPTYQTVPSTYRPVQPTYQQIPSISYQPSPSNAYQPSPSSAYQQSPSGAYQPSSSTYQDAGTQQASPNRYQPNYQRSTQSSPAYPRSPSQPITSTYVQSPQSQSAYVQPPQTQSTYSRDQLRPTTYQQVPVQYQQAGAGLKPVGYSPQTQSVNDNNRYAVAQQKPTVSHWFRKDHPNENYPSATVTSGYRVSDQQVNYQGQ